jgi:hypothetical protein
MMLYAEVASRNTC